MQIGELFEIADQRRKASGAAKIHEIVHHLGDAQLDQDVGRTGRREIMILDLDGLRDATR